MITALLTDLDHELTTISSELSHYCYLITRNLDQYRNQYGTINKLTVQRLSMREER